jgi:hypothetical protein
MKLWEDINPNIRAVIIVIAILTLGVLQFFGKLPHGGILAAIGQSVSAAILYSLNPKKKDDSKTVSTMPNGT